MQQSYGAMLGATIAAVTFVAWGIFRHVQKKRRWKPVGTVKTLYIHPIKSCRGIQLDNIVAHKDGVSFPGSTISDRSFLVVYDEVRYATVRQFSRMVLITPTLLSDSSLKLEAPCMDPIDVEIPELGAGVDFPRFKVYGYWCPGVDCGDAAAEWLSEFLGIDSARLVFHDARLPNRQQGKLLNFAHLDVYNKKPIPTAFQDCSPFNLVSQASLNHLNTKLVKKVNERSFRPNVVVEDCGAFEEDTWRRIRIGSAEFVFAKYCTRCLLTSVDPQTGVKDPDATVLETLREFRLCDPHESDLYRKSPKFCVDFVTVREGSIAVGDKVYVSLE